MSVLPPKVKGGGKRNFQKGAGTRNAGPTRKEYVTKVVGLESHTFNIGHAKFAAKYQKMVEAIANHIQKDYKGGLEIAKTLRDLSLPVIDTSQTTPPGSAEQLTWERYTYGKKMSRRQRGRSPSSRRTRNANTL
jgi:hypothetical protein